MPHWKFLRLDARRAELPERFEGTGHEALAQAEFVRSRHSVKTDVVVASDGPPELFKHPPYWNQRTLRQHAEGGVEVLADTFGSGGRFPDLRAALTETLSKSTRTIVLFRVLGEEGDAVEQLLLCDHRWSRDPIA